MHRANIHLPRDKAYLLAGLLGSLGILTLAFGFAYMAHGTAAKITYFQVWSWVFLLCLIGIGRGTALSRTQPSGSVDLPGWVTQVVTAVVLLSSFYFWLPLRIAVPAAIVTVAACAGLHWLRRDRACIPFLLVAGFVLCSYLIITTPLNRAAADMLPLMADANNFLLSGHDPYAQQYSNLFFYLPVQWLVYLPPVAAGVDVRVVNLACFAVVGFLGVWLVRSGRLDKVALLGLCPIMLSRASVEMMIRGQVWPLWALTVGFAATLLSPGKFWPAVLLGLLLATQQPTVVIAVLLGVWLLFHRGFASAFWVTVITTAVFAVIVAPWLAMHPALLSNLYIGIQDTIAHNRATDHSWDFVEVSLQNLLISLGLFSIRSALQAAAIAAGMLYLAAFRNIRLGTFLCTAGLVYMVAISLNIQVFKHYYYPGLLLLAIGIAIPGNTTGIGGKRTPLRLAAQA
jgi:hypothetical protein